MFDKKILGGVALTALALAMTPPALAQQTTGAVRGTVTDASGAPIDGATVTVRHVPTGTVSQSGSNAQGFFSASGLRAGGPYTIEVSAPNYQTQRLEDVSVSVQDAYQATFALEPAAEEAVIVVTASRVGGRTLDTGSGSRFLQTNIGETASIGRDLKDIFRRDPLVTIDPTNQNAFSFAGANTRLNKITVDGISQSDDFGLNNNGYPTQRTPISLDAIEVVEASAAPYSVTLDGFFGGNVNVVTKSGTNTFSGSAFYDYRDEQFRGSRVDFNGVATKIPPAPFEEKIWGGTLGGPIVKDKLFFFLNYEKFDATQPVGDLVVGLTQNELVPGITRQLVSQVISDARARYGAATGDVPSSVVSLDEKLLAKLDWNITDRQRAVFSYQRTEGNSFNGGGGVQGNTLSGTTAVALLSRQYDKGETLEQYRGELYSDWTDNFSTEVRVGLQNRETTQIPFGGLGIGQVNVDLDGLNVAGDGVGDATGQPTTPANAQVRFGPDTFRHDNFLEIDNLNADFRGELTLGKHVILAGFGGERLDFFNVFVPNALGTYNFATYADFLANRTTGYSLAGGLTPAQVSAGVAVPAAFGTARAGAADFKQTQYNAYLQDTWRPIDALTVTAGVRYINYSVDDQPLNNVAFRSRQGFANTATLDGRDAWLPRLGFNYEATDRVTISGGAGKFTGGSLNVWISNQYSNNGVNQVNAVCPAAPFTITSFNAVPAGCTFTPGNGNVNVLDPNFEIPTVWKYNLAGEARLLEDESLRVFANYLTTSVEDSVTWRDLRAQQVGVAPDGRPIYGRSTTGTIGANTFDMLLTNTKKGRSEVAVVGVEKDFEDAGIFVSLSYTHTEAKDANPQTSSVATSNYRNVASADHQNLKLATSDYEIEHSYKMELTWRPEFFGEYETLFSLFGEKRSGLPFSYTFNSSQSSINGTQVDSVFGHVLANNAAQNQLFYVPRASDIGNSVILSGYAAGEFDALISRLGLDGYRGSIAPRNAFRGSDVTKFDLRISQEIPAFFPNGAKAKFIMDVDNLGNLISDEWGIVEQRGFPRFVPVSNVSLNAARTQYTYSRIANVNPTNLNANLSLWTIKFGVRYEF